MKNISRLIFCCVMLAHSSVLVAKTVASEDERRMEELRAGMELYGRKMGVLPVGDDASIIVSLREVGFEIPKSALTVEGKLLDSWGNPYYFLRTKEGIAILSLGQKRGDGYPVPITVLVKAPRGK